MIKHPLLRDGAPYHQGGSPARRKIKHTCLSTFIRTLVTPLWPPLLPPPRRDERVPARRETARCVGPTRQAHVEVRGRNAPGLQIPRSHKNQRPTTTPPTPPTTLSFIYSGGLHLFIWCGSDGATTRYAAGDRLARLELSIVTNNDDY